MSSTINSLVLRLTSVEIPVLNATKQALVKLKNDPKASAAGIASVVLPDPMMTLRLIRLANATRHGEFAQRITTVEHAVMLLGFSTVFSRLVNAPALEDIKVAHVKNGLLAAANRACHAASMAREWAVQRLDTVPEEVYIAAQLHDMAELALWLEEPEKMQVVAQRRRKQPWQDAEREQFGATVLDLSLALAERWNMPPLVLSAMQEGIAEGKVRPNTIKLANQIIRHAETGWWQPQVSADIEALATVRRITADDAAVQVHQAAINAARRYRFPGIMPVAAWLPMLEGEWPSDAPKVAPAQADTYQTVMDEIIRRSSGTSLNLSDLLTLIIRGMRDGIGLRRIVFALLSQDRNELKPRYIYGADEASPLKKFHFDMRQRHLFSVLMSKQQAVWVSPETRAKYAPLWNEHISSITSGHDFYAMSLSVHGKVVGMLYADGAEIPLESGGYEKFKQLCTHAALGMTKLSKPQPAMS